MRNSTSTIFEVLAKENIQQILNDDKSMTKHRIKIQFNDPPEAYYAEILYHLLGPYTEKMKGETKSFITELGDEFKEPPGEKSAHIYFTASVAMKPGQKAKYEEYCTKLMKIFDEFKPEASKYSPAVFLKLYAEDDKITAKFLVSLPSTINPLAQMGVPDGLKEGLKDVDQYIKIKVVMGADAEEILNSDKPLLEHYLKGFSFQTDVVFLKKIKAAVMAGLENHPLGSKMTEGLKMAGPAFSVGSSLSLDLTFDDMEEVKAHPMASTVLVSMDQLLQGILGKDKAAILAYAPDFSAFNAEDLKKHVEASEYCKKKQQNLDMLGMIGDMLGDFNPDCKLMISGNVMDIGSLEYNIEGAGYGELVNLIYRAVTLKIKEDLVSRIADDFSESQN